MQRNGLRTPYCIVWMAAIVVIGGNKLIEMSTIELTGIPLARGIVIKSLNQLKFVWVVKMKLCPNIQLAKGKKLDSLTIKQNFIFLRFTLYSSEILMFIFLFLFRFKCKK